jgi:hypothetical protein
MQHVIEVRAGAELLVDVAQCGFPMIDEKGIANSSSPKSSLTFRQQVRQSRKVGAASKRPGNARRKFTRLDQIVHLGHTSVDGASLGVRVPE